MAGALAAIAVIAAAIFGINFLTRDDPKRALSAPSNTASAGQTSAAMSGSSSPGTAPAQSVEPKPAGTPTPPKSGGAKPAVTAPPAATVPPAPAAPPGLRAAPLRIPLTVLNSSRIRGLATTAARDFRAAGWPVGPDGIGNTSYRAKITTVYYLPGQEALARALMRDQPRVRRMVLRPSVLPGRGLTVVVTREYAG